MSHTVPHEHGYYRVGYLRAWYTFHMIINITENFFIELNTEWKQIWGNWNWYTFTLINIYFENGKYTGGYEAEITLLGFTIWCRYNTEEFNSKMREWLNDEDEPLR
jgi:hypothetical protein